MATRAVPKLTQQQLEEVMALIKGADSVELKASVPDADQRSVAVAMGMDPIDGEIRQIAFFDTPDLALNKAGVVVRARRIQRKPADSVVKLRPVDSTTISPKLRKQEGFGVEVDAMPGGFVCSASLKGKIDPDRAKEIFFERHASSKLFTKEQRSFYKDHAPEGLAIDDLVMLGPINIVKLKFRPPEFGGKMVAEMWLFPDGSRMLELSTKCLPNDASDVATRTRTFLRDHGVDLSAVQQTKTKTALQYFAANLGV